MMIIFLVAQRDSVNATFGNSNVDAENLKPLSEVHSLQSSQEQHVWTQI